MDGKEIAKLPTFEDAAKQLSERVKLAFVEMMPEDDFRARVASILQQFMSNFSDRYDCKAKPSEFENLITRELTNILREKVRGEIEGMASANNKYVSEEQFKKFIAEITPAVVSGLMAEMVQQVLLRMGNLVR